jgi:predicted transposase/invertase (TIGR01784 family)
MKKILRDKSNFDILEGFLSELLHEQIKIDSLLESEGNKDYEDSKFNRVDLLAHTSKNEKIIVEVQTASEWDFYQRILFGTSKVITEYIKEGEPYSKVPKVISVSILHFNLGEGKDYIYKGNTEFTGLHLKDTLKLSEESINLYINNIDKTYNAVSDIFPTYYLIQLPKFTGEVRDKFDQWVYLLSKETIKNDFDAQGIISAKEKLDVLRLTESERIAYNKYWQNVSFEASLAETHQVKMAAAKQEGHAEGRNEGKKEAKFEIARKMLASGMSTNQVVDIVEISLEELSKIKD